MNLPQEGKNWFFVDEAGDPTFYDRRGNYIVGKEGCSPILMLGFIETQDPKSIRTALLDLQREIVHDPYFQGVPSIEKTSVSFHAKDDLPEVRMLVYKLLVKLEFKAQFIVARKIERVFRNSFNAKETKFYDHLVSTLFSSNLHHFQENIIYFSKRGSRDRQSPLVEAIQQGIQDFEETCGTHVATDVKVYAHKPAGEPCLSAIDYMNWAVFRAFTRGEMRYYKTVEEKVSLLIDLYDNENYPNNLYSHNNLLEIRKITPLQLGSVTERTA